MHFLNFDRKIFRSKEIDYSCQFDETFIYKYIRKFERKLIDMDSIWIGMNDGWIGIGWMFRGNFEG